MTLVLIYIRETIKLKVKVDRERPIIILKQFLILKKKKKKEERKKHKPCCSDELIVMVITVGFLKWNSLVRRWSSKYLEMIWENAKNENDRVNLNNWFKWRGKMSTIWTNKKRTCYLGSWDLIIKKISLYIIFHIIIKSILVVFIHLLNSQNKIFEKKINR